MNNQEKQETTKEDMEEIYFMQSVFINKDGIKEYFFIPYNPRIFNTAYYN